MLRDFLILDVATTAIADAGSFVEPVSAPSNYKDEAKIAEYVRDKTAERLASVALDLDLARVTAIGVNGDGHGPRVCLCADESEERMALVWLADQLWSLPTIVTYGGFNFDLPILMRRARYLGLDFPKINLDRYKSSHVDLVEVLTDRNPQRRRPLGFYVRRLGWTDLVKPLSGEQEARVPETGLWAELEASVRHDVTATYRLAQWLGFIAKDAAVLA